MGESTIDAVVGVTLVDSNGEIRHYHAPDPDVKARDRPMCVMLGVGGRGLSHGIWIKCDVYVCV